jgi:ubiquinone/menaquinone biosynthesis C-methylase UbiE
MVVAARPMTDHEPSVIVGNVYDKYATRNPVARWLMCGFLNAVSDLYLKQRPIRVLEVGCGEGHLAQHLFNVAHTPEAFHACDLSLSGLAQGLDERIHFSEASIYALPFESKSFDLVVCCEVLEHLESPDRGLAEICRVSSNRVIVSTPREPLWRVLNMLRGKYLSALGNTPGHVQHFTQAGLLDLLCASLHVVAVRAPVPWTVVLGQVRGLSSNGAPGVLTG